VQRRQNGMLPVYKLLISIFNNFITYLILKSSQTKRKKKKTPSDLRNK